MRFLANISPTLKLTRRLSCNSNVRRYTSLVKVLPCQRYSNNLMLPNTALKKFYCVDKTDKTNLTKTLDSVKLKDSQINEHVADNSNLIMPMALLNLNLQNSISTKVLLIPLNWQETDNKTMVNIISSIFAKRTNLRQIDAFGEALREVPNLNKDSAKEEAKKNEELSKESAEISELAKPNNPKAESSLMPIAGENMDNLDRLAAAVEKALQKCCLQSMQMYVDANILEGTIKGTQFSASVTGEADKLSDISVKSQNKGKPLSLSSIMEIDASKLNLNEISWNKNNPFPEMHTSSLTNITFPLNMIRKSYSTRSTIASQQSTKIPAINSTRYADEEAPLTFKASSERSNVMDITFKRNASNMSTSKCNANYDFPFLTNLFGAKELLLSCDAYNKALIEASKRRAALLNCTAELKSIKDVAPSRPQVTSVKGCNAPSVADVKPSRPCPPPAKQASQGGCKKDDPCKPAECPDPCKDEMEKLQRQESEAAKAKKNKMPIGCVSPKCKKDDGCSQTKKSPCKKASATSQMPAVKKADGGCKKDDPCKPPECPNPCKDEMEKLEKLKEENAKRNKNKIPTGCISPKCKKNDGCSNPKKSPCKKASAENLSSATVLQCSKSGGNKGKSNTCGKGKDKKNPCADDHKEYKPKCNADPCKKDSEPCGGDKPKKKPDHCKKNKKKPVDKCKKKEADSCGGDKKKEDPCKKKKSDSCGGDKKKEDPCKKKKSDSCGGDKKKEDPCKKKKSDSCGGDKKKEDPCKKKKSDSCGGDKKKEDPCKKKKSDSCGGDKKKEDPCKKKKSDPCGGDKKKEDPCKKKKSDPCGKKSEKSSPCGSKKKAPCGSSKKKEDPCKKKSSSPCKSDSKSSGGSKKNSSCGKEQRDTKPNCNKNNKCFSTLAINAFKTTSDTTKRSLASFAGMPTIRNKNMYSFGFMRHFSSKGGKKNKKDIDHGRSSQCNSIAPIIPPKRTPAYNPHPKEGLRKCFESYDMDCKKLCKDARQTACKKYAFLKSTDSNTRKDKK